LEAPRAPRHRGFGTITGPCVLALIGLSAVLALAGGSAHSATAAGAQKPNAVKQELIVGFESGVSRAEQNDALKRAGASSKKRFGQIDAVLVRVKEDEETTVSKLLSSDRRVAYVEPNHVVTVAATPNDPDFARLWGLHNTGQTGGTSDKDVDAPEAWDLATGDGSVVVAVTDTGVDFTHPDLAAQRWVNPLDPVNGADDDGNGLVDDWSGWDWVNDDNSPFDDNRHGTHVAGTIGATGNNGVGVVGVNWNVRIMALKFLNSAGSGTTADAIDATLYAADHDADVASNSWGGGPYDQALRDAIEYGASRGMLFVAAAGNDASNNDTTASYPASYGLEAVLAVAATDHNDSMAFFSNYGAKSVDLGAPGVGIYSTVPGSSYQSLDGTSMATPHVSGAATLVKDHFPGATLYGIKALLMNTVDPAASLAGRTVSGGRLNVGRALACDGQPHVVLGAPAEGFVAGVGDEIPIRVLGANCAIPAGVGNVTATVNGTTVSLSAESPDSGLYTGTYTASAAGPLTVTATVSVGGLSDTQSASGNAYVNYTCVEAPFSWVDVTGIPPLAGADGDDTVQTLNIGFQVPFFGQSYGTAYISSNGFLTLGSSAGATAYLNASIPTSGAPNGVIAPFWDDLYPGATGSVHAGWAGPVGSRVLHIEWFNVPEFTFFGSGGAATFEVAIQEGTGDIKFQWLDTDFGNPSWNLGASATAGLERADGLVGRQLSFNQPLLTPGRAVSCTYGAPPPPPPPPPPLEITTTSLPDGTVDDSYSQALAATGGTTPYTWSLDDGALPPGLTLDSATGVVSGTPTAAGSFSFTVRATDGGAPAQADTQALSITVAPAPVPPPQITTTALPAGTVGTPYSQALSATDGTQPYAWSLDSGELPPGIGLDPATGALSGTPTAQGTFAFTVRLTDAGTPAQSDTQTLSIAVAAAPLAITTASLPPATAGEFYSHSLQASGGVTPYSWTRVSGSMPRGLTLSSSGVISGTPAKRGTSTFTVRVTDSAGAQVSKTFSLQVNRR
jgi:subtilisin family serine protease